MSEPQYGGKECLHQREPLVGTKPCNEHACSKHPAACGVSHVRCDVKMLEHHKSNYGIRKTLSTCGHTTIEEQNECWNNDNCKTCASVHSNEDSCNAERCHDADTDSEKAMQAKLEADYQACLAGNLMSPLRSLALTNTHRAGVGLGPFQCRKNWPTLQVTHDRENMEQLGQFKCAKTSATTCACHCDRHAPCCAQKNKLLSNKMVFGNRFTGVNVLQDCCNMCTNHPECTAWEYTSEKVCILKHGVVSTGSYTANPLPGKITTWAGTPSGVGTC